MFQVSNLLDNDNVLIKEAKGPFRVVEYQRDLSVTPNIATEAYFAAQMNIHRRQLVCDVSQGDIVIQSGAMQWFVGDVQATTGLKGAGDFLSKTIKGRVTGESAIKPQYTGDGWLVLEPTYKHIILLDVSEWGPQGVAIEDGMFMAAEARVKQTVVARSSISSAVAGGEGLFNLGLQGNGVVALESHVPMEELIEVTLNNDTLKVDGDFALAWSAGLQFTVERSSRTLVGSAVTDEGLVNTFRGTGKILLAPVLSSNSMIK